MKRYFLLSLVSFLLLAACQTKKNNSKRLEEINPKGGVAEIIRNPATAEGPVDTVNVAKMTFSSIEYQFGEVKEGKVVEHTFEFTNTGKVPLLISDARSTCGCTVPEWSEKPVEPGKKGKIKVRFNTTGKVNEQHKLVTITANTYPSKTIVLLQGYVHPKS